MSDSRSIEHVFDLAIRAERLAETLYLQLANRFSRNPDIEDFWIRYAREERQHGNWLGALRAQLSPEQLALPADVDVLEMANRTAAMSIDQMLGRVKTLQDAYVLAHELEHDEINTVFEFLICHYSENPEAMKVLRAELNRHINRLLIDFPKRYGTGTLRRGVVSG